MERSEKFWGLRREEKKTSLSSQGGEWALIRSLICQFPFAVGSVKWNLSMFILKMNLTFLLVKMAVLVDLETVSHWWLAGDWGRGCEKLLWFRHINPQKWDKTLTWHNNHLSAGPKMQDIPYSCLSAMVDHTTKTLPLRHSHTSWVSMWKLKFLRHERGFRHRYHESNGIPYSFQRLFLILGPAPAFL